ncbi:HAD-IA family hydrolase [Aliiroseovarius sp. PTFE2010]|uniref:HAD-IA family hydrolase n=1 Tax=Aliiroseovarius sp. PTFE2010 TaxID=3417190 RepID=UPI003CF94D9F
MRTIVFDLDGTLADTSGDLLAAANACFADMGHGPLLGREDQAVAFSGGRGMLAEGLRRTGHSDPGPVIDRYYPILLDAYRDAICVHTTLYPGAVDAIKALRASGARTAICTNKPEGLARILLDQLGVADLFDALVGADTLRTRKPDPAPFVASVQRAGGRVEASCLIGDTQTDRDTARAAGVPCVLVSFGPEGAEIARLAPHALLDHFDDLQRVVAKVLD